MEIKKVLKNLDVRISRLAKDLNISRPTLDTYIECYESGKAIPNEIYQQVFDYLFVSEDIDPIEFAKRFDYVKRTILNDYKDDKESTREQNIRNNISDIAFSTDVDKSLLEFINLFINNRKVELVVAIYNYFNYVNGIKEYEDSKSSEKDKALFSKLYKIFYEYQNNNIEIDNQSYEDFKAKNMRICDKKKIAPTDEQLIDYLKSHTEGNAGLDFDYIRELLDKREN